MSVLIILMYSGSFIFMCKDVLDKNVEVWPIVPMKK